ncbi:MAG: hypothetical protein DMG09_23030 [Acidobacteria bacterium]|nr:MAG: hypothetical protein DMG09_23030 [Acidobacteriota bacterium]
MRCDSQSQQRDQGASKSAQTAAPAIGTHTPGKSQNDAILLGQSRQARHCKTKSQLPPVQCQDHQGCQQQEERTHQNWRVTKIYRERRTESQEQGGLPLPRDPAPAENRQQRQKRGQDFEGSQSSKGLFRG